MRGLVQGVGFRPTVWRIARELRLRGSVRNDGDGVLIRLWGAGAQIDAFIARLHADCPPLARIDEVCRSPLDGDPERDGFYIVESAATAVHTGVVPDAAVCAACAAEVDDPVDRRHRYPFTNCTHCGPRLSIIERIPYDRANTSMRAFPLCRDCAAEYADPANRRFHAQPNACPVCGPRAWLVESDGSQTDMAALEAVDAVDAASRLLAAGRIVAIKGIGGFHLACDATNAGAVDGLRRRKRRWQKPFALMARDLDVVRAYCRVSELEAQALLHPAAPVVLLEAKPSGRLAPGVAPGQTTLGCMLPYSPLHRLLLRDWRVPLVMTSGNSSDEPQCIHNDDARARLAPLADALLLHDRAIVNRVDDSVVRVMDAVVRPLRRARGYAPAPLPLPAELAACPPVLALGGELKNTICLLEKGRAVLSQHLGDLNDALTAREFAATVDLYRRLFEHAPAVIAVDRHPNYRASALGRELAAREGLGLVEVQHHRGHVAAVLADQGYPVDGEPVLGVALDGSGYGDDGSIWGGEWFVGDYRQLRRVAHLKPVALPGGTRAILEPWRNLFAQLHAHLGWERFEQEYAGNPVAAALDGRPTALLRRMVEQGINTPQTTSCGRLFDAVAAALGICADGIAYEGQAAIELEALARTAPKEGTGYGLRVQADADIRQLDPAPLWAALLDDLARQEARATIAARFHRGLADAVVMLSVQLCTEAGVSTVALSGGVFQNRTLFERVAAGLRGQGLRVLAHQRVPANDGGLSLGQGVIAALAAASA